MPVSALDHIDRLGDLVTVRPRAVEVQEPVPADARQPLDLFVLLHGQQPEARDRALAAGEIGIEQLDGDVLFPVDRLRQRSPYWIVRVAQRALPHAGVSTGDEEVARLHPELLLRTVVRRLARQGDACPGRPALADTDAVANVADVDREVDVAIDVVGGRVAARGVDPVAVGEVQLLDRVVEA